MAVQWLRPARRAGRCQHRGVEDFGGSVNPISTNGQIMPTTYTIRLPEFSDPSTALHETNLT